MIMFDAFTLSCRLRIWMIQEYVVCYNQDQGQRSSKRVSDSKLWYTSVSMHKSTVIVGACAYARDVRVRS